MVYDTSSLWDTAGTAGLNEGFLATYMTLVIVLSVVALVINIVLMIWVYKDAEKHGKGGALWLIITLLTGWIGCLIYLIIRNK